MEELSSTLDQLLKPSKADMGVIGLNSTCEIAISHTALSPVMLFVSVVTT